MSAFYFTESLTVRSNAEIYFAYFFFSIFSHYAKYTMTFL